MAKLFIPFLTRAEAELLASAPYEEPKHVTRKNEQELARSLTRRKLLERAPGLRSVYRCTDFGTAVVLHYRQVKWLPWNAEHLTRSEARLVIAHELGLTEVEEAKLFGPKRRTNVVVPGKPGVAKFTYALDKLAPKRRTKRVKIAELKGPK